MHAIVRLLTLLAGDTDSLTVTASGASLLSTDTDTPSVTETTVSTANDFAVRNSEREIVYVEV